MCSKSSKRVKICSAFSPPVSMHRGGSGHLFLRQVSQQTAKNVKMPLALSPSVAVVNKGATAWPFKELQSPSLCMELPFPTEQCHL